MHQQRDTIRTPRLWGMFRTRCSEEKACPVSMVSGQNPSQQVSLHCTCFVICAPTRAAQPTCTCYSSHTAVSTNRKSNTCNDISVPSFLPQLYVDEKLNDWLNDTKYFSIGAKPKIQYLLILRCNGRGPRTENLHLMNSCNESCLRLKSAAIS